MPSPIDRQSAVVSILVALGLGALVALAGYWLALRSSVVGLVTGIVVGTTIPMLYRWRTRGRVGPPR